MERGRIDPETGAPAPTWFKLLDLEEARQHGIALSNDCLAENEDDDEGVSNIADTPEEIAGGISNIAVGLSSNDGGISNIADTPVKIDRGDIENCWETYQ